MNTSKHFPARVSALLRCLTLGIVLLLLGLMVFGFSDAKLPVGLRILFVLSPPLFIFGGLLFTVRGFTVEPGVLLVQRWLWRTPVDLRGLRSAEVDPGAFRRTIRIWGNGGFFSFSGWFWNSRLRRFRAFATDLRQPVVLTFADHRVVVTPERPDELVALLKQRPGVQ